VVLIKLNIMKDKGQEIVTEPQRAVENNNMWDIKYPGLKPGAIELISLHHSRISSHSSLIL